MRLLALVWVALVGCMDTQLVPCGDLLCPSTNVCTPGGCALPADVDVCTGLDEGAACTSVGGDEGVCTGGACRTGLCGNAKLDPGEQCDDANQVSGDGCRADCKKLEVCGDGTVDANEQCDDGNSNPADSCDACAITSWVATTVVGGEVLGTSVGLSSVYDVAGDSIGRAYFIDGTRIRRVELDGSLTTVAGTGVAGSNGDGGPAAGAQLSLPEGITVDGLGRLYIADYNASTIRRVDVDGTISTIIGRAGPGFTGDGSTATFAKIFAPWDVAVDGLGRIVIADNGNQRVRRIELDGNIQTIAGTGTAGFSNDGLPGFGAQINQPRSLAIDVANNVYFVDTGNSRIRRIDGNGFITTIAGNGGSAATADGVQATAASISPLGLAFDGSGRLMFGDLATSRIRCIEFDGTIKTIAGTTSGFSGDGGPATAAQLRTSFGVALDGLGRTIFADTTNGRIRRIATDGIVTTIAGNGSFGTTSDGFEAASIALLAASDVVFDTGRIVTADRLGQRVRRVELDGTMVTLAGNGSIGFGIDGLLATTQPMNYPTAVAIDAQERVLVAEGCRVRALDATGVFTRIAGTLSTCGFSGDTTAATTALLQTVTAIATDPAGRLYIADATNQRIRMVSATGTITTIAGNGATGSLADGVQATTALLGNPTGVAIDSTGRVLIADAGQHKVRRIELDGTITTVAGTGSPGSAGEGVLAAGAPLSSPSRLAVDATDQIFIADAGNARVRKIATDGTITTIAGTGTVGFTGDGGSATAATFNTIIGIAVDAGGRVAIADDINNRVRLRAPTGTLTTIAGKVDPDGAGPVAIARLASPSQLVVTPSFTLAASTTSGVVEIVANGTVTGAIGRYPQAIATGALARFRTNTFGAIGGIAFDPTTNVVYVAETTANRIHAVTLVDPAQPMTWTIAPLANVAGTAGAADGAAATARFRSPNGLFVDAAARILYITDTGNHSIRALDLATQMVSTVVDAQYRFGFGGDGGPASAALLYAPSAVTRCPNGDLFIADTGNNRVRRVDSTHTITTVLGDGSPSTSGQGTPATQFSVNAPRGLACDTLGNLFVTSTTGVRILPADANGTVDGSGSVATIYGALPHIRFPDVATSCLSDVAVTGPATIQVADACAGLVVGVTRTTAP